MKRKIFFCFIFIFGFLISFASTEKLVSLQGTNSQNSQYVEIQRSPQKRTDTISYINNESLPKAHGLSTNSKKSTTDIRRRPQNPSSPTITNGLPPPFAPVMMMPSLMPISPFSNLLNIYPQMQPIPNPSISQYPHHLQHQTNHVQILPTPSPLSSNTIQTLSPTLAPTMPTIAPMTFPTFPTLFPMATFPAFTLPPSFDKMAAGYIKKDKKKKRKHRRKPIKKTHNSNENNSDFDEKSEKTLPKVESRLPKFADEENSQIPKTDGKDWMVPYYSDDKKNQS